MDMKYERITIDSSQMGGVPCLRHKRIPVATVLKLFAESASFDTVLNLYPDLEMEDLRQALAFAASSVEEREIALAS